MKSFKMKISCFVNIVTMQIIAENFEIRSLKHLSVNNCNVLEVDIFFQNSLLIFCFVLTGSDSRTFPCNDFV